MGDCKFVLKLIRITVIFNFIVVFTPLNIYSQDTKSKIEKLNKSKVAPVINIDRKGLEKINIRVQVSNVRSFENWMIKNAASLKYSKLKYTNIYEIKEISTDQIKMLANNEFVNFIDVSHRTVVEERLMDDSDLAANKIEAVHVLYPELTGQDLTVSVKENLFDIIDIDFKGRIKNIEYGSDVLSLHATMMTTLIAGAGNNGPKGKGVAWKAEIVSSDFSNLFPDDDAILLQDDISVQNHSYGISQIENYYGLESQQYDIVCLEFPKILHVFSSGNVGSSTSEVGNYAGIEAYANLTGQFKTSKNTLAVGEMDSYGEVKEFSSRGPAFDGRVKPELVAFGFKGSSESAALVSGISLLVQDAYKKENNGALPNASLVKSILINSADDVGRPEVDFENGYGSVDALGAINTVVENRYFMDTISDSEEKIFSIIVPENAFMLKVTVVWHDLEAPAGTKKALINDLDIELSKISSGSKWEPWVLNSYPHIDSLTKSAIRSKDHLNNIEQITLKNPDAGEYELRIVGYDVKSNQEFCVAYEYEKEFQWIFPFKENGLQSDKDYQIRWLWNANSQLGDIEYRLVEDDNWITLANSIDLSVNYFDWQVPDITSLAQIRIKTDSQEFLSDTFLISKSMDIKVGMNCDDEALFFWKNIEDVDEYKIYRLGDKFLEPFISTSDTFFTISGLEKEYLNYSVSPVINHMEGLRSKTINYTSQNIDCYFVSFIPMKYVTDTVLLNLELSSNYRLSALNLERYDKGSFRVVQRIEPVLFNKFELLDDNPNLNRNLYRVRLERDDSEEILSHEEEVYFNPIGSLLIYPNPIHSGQEINIIDGEDEASSIRIFDSSGRIYYMDETNIGMIKSIPTNEFKPGIYFIEIKSGQGFKKIRKIIVL